MMKSQNQNHKRYIENVWAMTVIGLFMRVRNIIASVHFVGNNTSMDGTGEKKRETKKYKVLSDNDERECITLEGLHNEDWEEIRSLAVKFHNAGSYGGNQGKCWIQAFVHWLGTRNFYMTIDNEETTTYH